MCKAIEDMILDAQAEGRAEGKAEGEAEGIAKGIAEIAQNMLLEGMDVDLIAKVTKLSKDAVLSLRSQLPVHAQ